MRQQTILKHSAIQKEKHPISVPTMAPYSGAFLLFAGVLVFLKGYETLCIYLRVCNLSAAKHFFWKSCFLDTCIAVDLRKRSCMTNCTKDNNKIVQYPLPAVALLWGRSERLQCDRHRGNCCIEKTLFCTAVHSLARIHTARQLMHYVIERKILCSFGILRSAVSNTVPRIPQLIHSPANTVKKKNGSVP